VLATLALVAACGRGPAPTAPVNPEASVRAFLDAVRANSLVRMGDLFGGSRGPASGYMAARELEQRLTIIRIYLEHERAEVLPPDESMILADPGTRVFRVRLTRRGCAPVVPFTLTEWRGRWLVTSIDLNAVVPEYVVS